MTLCAASEVSASQSITVSVVNESGTDARARDIQERDDDGASFASFCSSIDFESGYCRPHSYRTVRPEIVFQLYKDDVTIGSPVSYGGTTTIDIDTPGLYEIICSTTVQVDRESVKLTQVLSGQTIPAPQIFDGTDEQGAFEIAVIALFEDAGRWAFRYTKRYTYQVVVSTLTYVAPGEADKAIMLVPQDSDSLARLANTGTTDVAFEQWLTPEDVSNAAAKKAMNGAVDKVLRKAITGKFLRAQMASHTANVLFLAFSRDALDRPVESLLKTSIGSGISTAICVKLGVASAGGPGIVIGVATSLAVEYFASKITWALFQDRLGRSIADDWITVRTGSAMQDEIALLNLGNPIAQVRLATDCERVIEHPGYGTASSLATGQSFTFRSIPESWFGKCDLLYPGWLGYGAEMLFDAVLLGGNRTVALDVNYDQVTHATGFPAGQISISVSGVAPGDLNASLLYLNETECARKDSDLGTAPSGTTFLFQNLPFGGGYLVDAYCWDMWVGETEVFTLAESSVSKTITAKPRRPLQINVVDGSLAPQPGLTVTLSSWDGYRNESHLRATAVTGSDGMVSFQAWPTTKPDERYVVAVSNSQGVLRSNPAVFLNDDDIGLVYLAMLGGATLSNGSVSPDTGTTAGTFTYSVSYVDSSGSSPLSAQVLVDGIPFGMALVVGTQGNGTYRFTKYGLAAGKHNYQFLFRSSSGVDVRFPQSGASLGPTVSTDSGQSGRVKISVFWGGNSTWDDGQGGLVDPNVSWNDTFSSGEQHWFTAYPGFGWTLDNWRIRYIWSQSPQSAYFYPPDAASGSSAMMITRDVERNANNWAVNAIYCKFRRTHEDQRVLTVSKLGPGTVSPGPGQYEYPLAASVLMTATPSTNGRFVRWMRDGTEVSTSPIYLLDIASQDHSILAVFQYNLTAVYTNDLPCSADATIRMESPDEDSNGDRTESWVSFNIISGRTHTWDSVFKFDVSSIPADAIVKHVFLRLYCTDIPGHRFGYEIQRNTSDWDEDTIRSVQPSCLNPFAYNGYGLFKGDENAYHEHEISSTIPEAVNWIREWRIHNYGLRLRPSQSHVDEGDSYEGYYEFSTRHLGDSKRWPVLRVVYEGRRMVPQIAVEPPIIAVQAARGLSPSSLAFAVRNAGEGTLAYLATISTNWVELMGAVSGTCLTNEEKQIGLSFKTEDLQVGTYQALITIVDTNASSSPIVVPVNLTVIGSVVGVFPSNLVVTTEQAFNPASTTLEVRNTGVGTLDFSLSKTANWLILSQTSGSSTGEVRQIPIQFDTSMLHAGRYQDNITVENLTDDSPPIMIPVVLTVLDRVAAPTFSPAGNTSYREKVLVTLSTATPEALITYTLNGSVPTETSPSYQGTPIPVEITSVLRARAWKQGMLPSSEVAATYEIIQGTLPSPPEIAWWRMEKDASGNVADATGKGHTAVVSGSPSFGYAQEIGESYVQFDGNSWLRVEDADDFDLLGDWTIALWTKPGQLFNEVELWTGKVRSYHDDEGGWAVNCEANSAAVVFYGTPSGNVKLAGGLVAQSVWSHVAVTHNAQSLDTGLYVNGQFITNRTIGPLKANSYRVLFGVGDLEDGVTINPGYRSKGALADVRIYGRPLSADEIQRIAAAPPRLEISLGMPDFKPRLVIIGTIGRTYRLESTESLGSLNWTVLTNITFSTPWHAWEDTSAVTNRPKFYRAVLP